MSKARNLATLLSSDGSVKPTKYADSVGGQATFVASGALADGTVLILNSDGTVTEAGGVTSSATTGSTTIPDGSVYTFDTSNTAFNMVAFSPTVAGKFVLTYRDHGASLVAKAVVGQITNNTISFGSDIQVTSSPSAHYEHVAWNPNNADQVVFVYVEGSSTWHLGGKVGTVSGTSISLGSEFLINSGTASTPTVSFDPNTAGSLVFCYVDQGNSSYGTCRAATLAANGVLTWGTKTVFKTASTGTPAIAFDPNVAGRFLVTFIATEVHAILGTVSGTTLSFGSSVQVSSGSTATPNHTVPQSWDPQTSGSFVIPYKDSDTYGYIRAGTANGTNITLGSAVTFVSENINPCSARFHPTDSAGSLLIEYFSWTTSDPKSKVRKASVSGTTVTLGALYSVTTGTGNHNYGSFEFSPLQGGRFVYKYSDASDSGKGKIVCGQIPTTLATTSTNLTATNFIGISSAAYADTETATLNLQGGTATNLSGLTAGTTYYAQGDGTLGASAGTPSVEVGKALSSTSILLKGI
mgnify:CR=1 FL=1|jgi:hypothetical protein